MDELKQEKQKELIKEKKMMTDEFMYYRGQDMFTPTEPYINSELYEEEPQMVQSLRQQKLNQNLPIKLKRGQQLKAVPAKMVQNVLVSSQETLNRELKERMRQVKKVKEPS